MKRALPRSPRLSSNYGILAFQRNRERALAVEIESIERQLNIARKRITPEVIERFGAALKLKLVEGDPNFRRAYFSLIVDRVTLSRDEIHIAGSRAALEHPLVSDKAPHSGGVVP